MTVEDLYAALIQNTSGTAGSVGKKRLRSNIEQLLAVNDIDINEPEVSGLVNVILRAAADSFTEEFNDMTSNFNELMELARSNVKELEKLSESYKTHYNEALTASAEAREIVSTGMAELNDIRKLLPAIHSATREMESALKRYDKTKRLPNAIATSTTKHKWICSECGTELGRVDLYGLATGEWGRLPVYCPGCGAKTPYGDPYNDSNDVQRVNYGGE